MKTRFESKIEHRCYCENCRAEYLSSPGEGCPVCNAREEKKETTKEGSGKSE